MFSAPANLISDIIAMGYPFGKALWVALEPWIWTMVGIGLATLAIAAVFHFFEDRFEEWLDWPDEKLALEKSLAYFQDIYGKEEGSKKFLQARAFYELNKDDKKFLSSYERMFGQSKVQTGPPFNLVNSVRNEVFLQGSGWIKRWSNKKGKELK